MCYQPVLVPKPYHPQSYMQVPCRRCAECRAARAREWSLRCASEMSEHQQSCFITLSYATSPITLQKKDLQDFIKRLRKSIEPKKIKYFACGEYGSTRFRPHYHLIIFGYDFDDKYFWSKSKSGHNLYRSAALEKCWSLGNVWVQDATIETAGYISLYATKNGKNGHGLPPHLWDVPEFNTMSQGLGINHLLENIDQHLKTDTIWYQGQSYSIPEAVLNKHFGKHTKKWIDFDTRPSKLVALKEKRKKKAKNSDNYIDVTYDGDYAKYLSDKKMRAEKKRDEKQDNNI